jgi:sterol desaturase/sphingolipid hydroxylase (fatty acid hydroxylase superfamily)
MSHLLNFLPLTSEESEVVVFALTLFLCWNVENIAGLTSDYKKWNHASLNSKFILSNIPIQFLLGFAFDKTIHYTGLHHFGILYHLYHNPGHLAIFIYTFILLDLGEFIYHLLMHKIKRLWMFHAVHHTDRILDVSTSLREHPGENIIRNAFTLIWVFLSGAAFWALLLRQIIQIFSNIFAHINYRLPEKLDLVVGSIFITPNLHHVHHHYQQPYTDCNYGDVLSIWDRLFKTFQRLPSTDVVFGVDTYMDQKINGSYIPLLKLPFGKYIKANQQTNPKK